MTKYFKIFSLLLVALLTLGFSGCGKDREPVDDDPPIVQLTQAQVISMFSEFIDFEDPNFTITLNADYTISMQEELAPVQSQSDNVQNMVFKFSEGNTYQLIPNEYENYNIGNFTYSKDLYEQELGYDIDYSNNNYGDLLFNPTELIETIVSENFANLMTFNSSWVSSQLLATGAYSLSVGTNLKEELTALISAISTNGDNTLEELINHVLAIHYGSQLTVDQIVIDIKQNITSTSTVSDVIEFIGQEFGFSLINTFNSIMQLSGEEFNPEANFYEMIEISTDSEFALLIDGFVTEYLSNPELTLNEFINSIPDSEEAGFLLFIKQLYLSLSQITIDDFSFNINFQTDVSKQHLSLINVSVAIDATVMGVNYTIAANASVAFSNHGSTSISAPSLNSIEEIYIDLNFNSNELTRDSEKVISNVNFGLQNFTLSNYDQTQTLIYNATNHTLTLSASSVNNLLDYGYTYLSHSELDYYSYLSLNYETQ